jgi:hypothetical protein
VLSARAPGLAQALERAMAEGARFVVLDRKVFETDRLTETVTSAHHRQSQENHRDSPGSTCPHAIRAQVHPVNISEITSLKAAYSGPLRAHARNSPCSGDRGSSEMRHTAISFTAALVSHGDVLSGARTSPVFTRGER